ncbi:MAG TPA: flagellar biosynthesis protein FlhF [Gammaproteobacteria bacterium]|nr:flagellar biosynthesis protein FlhF [Gammaproteobacteria bacterium]
MKIKRFFANDMRQALRQVREVMGPDAAILSTDKLEDGVEIIAAMDYDSKILASSRREQSHMAKQAVSSSQTGGRELAEETASAPTTYEKRVAGTTYEDLAHRLAVDDAQDAELDDFDTPEVPPVVNAPHRESTSAIRQALSGLKIESNFGDSKTMDQLREEMQGLRDLMEQRFAGLAWGNLENNSPLRASLLRRLDLLGFEAEVATHLTDLEFASNDLDSAWQKVLNNLVDQLKEYPEDLTSHGGIVALVGPTGAGKTTTLAKLAARFSMKHGSESVALITTDCYRIAAHEQLRAYGRIMGIPVRVAEGLQALREQLNEAADKRLVLIDTAGMSQRDNRLREQLSMLRQASDQLQSMLVFPATSQALVLEETIEAFDALSPDGCMITKVDECTSLGGALSVAIRHQLSLAFMTDGQRVPEDIHRAVPVELVNRCIDVAKQSSNELNEEVLAKTYGSLIANAHR